MVEDKEENYISLLPPPACLTLMTINQNKWKLENKAHLSYLML